MKLQITKGTTSKILALFVRDSSSTTGAGLTGLTNASSGLVAYYWREGDATATSISLVTMTLGTYTSGGFKEMDATNMPGWYSFCPPNAALASGANNVAIHLKGATNMAPLPLEIQLNSVDLYDPTRAGLTALPNAAAGATGGLACLVANGGTATAGGASTITLAASASTTANFYNGLVIAIIGGTGVGQARTIVGYSTGRVATVDAAWATAPDATSVYEVRGDRAPGVDSTANVFVSSGTGANQVNLSSGNVGVQSGTGANQVNLSSGNVGVQSGTGANQINLSSGNVGVQSGTSANQISLASGLVTVGTNNDKTGYTVSTNNDKTGYSLAALDSFVLASGTASAGSSTTLTLAGASTTANLFNGLILKIYGGTGAGQARVITAYSAARVATVDTAWTTTPDNTSLFAVLAVEAPKLDSSQQVTAASVQGNVTGSVASVSGNVGGSVGSVTGAVGSVTGNVGGSVASVTAPVTVGTNNDKTGYGLSVLESAVLENGTAQAGAASTITLRAGASATDDLFKGEVIKIYSGTGLDQVRVITGYVGATKVATVDRAWATNPDNTSLYAVLAFTSAKLDTSLQVAAGSVQGNVTGSVASVSGSVGSVAGNVVGSVGSVAGNVSGSVASVVGAVGSVTGAVGSVTGSVGSVAAGGITTASFAAGAIDSTIFAQSAANRILTGATLAELSQAQPPTTPTLAQAQMLIYMALRNMRTITATTDSITNDAGTVISKSTVSDDGTTFTRAKMVTGP